MIEKITRVITPPTQPRHITEYKASDGTVFAYENEAIRHEEYLARMRLEQSCVFSHENWKVYKDPNLNDIELVYNKKYPKLQIKVHGSWLNNLQYILDRLTKITNIPLPKAKIIKDGWAYFAINNCRILYCLKKKVIELNIPALERKWSKVNLNVPLPIHNKTKIEKYIELFNQGLSSKDISTKLNVNIQQVYHARYKVKKNKSNILFG